MVSRVKNDTHWGFVSGRISALESHFMQRDFFLNLINQERIDDLVPHLQETFLRDCLTPGTVWADFSDLSDKCFSEILLSLRNDCPSNPPVDLFLIKNDYLNLKNALVRKPEYPFAGISLSPEQLNAIAGGDLSELPRTVQDVESGLSLETGIDTENMDIILDGAYLRHLPELASAINSNLISDYVRFRVLTHVIIILWRAAKKGLSAKKYLQYLLPLGELNPLLSELVLSPSPETWIPLVGGEVADLILQALKAPGDEQIASFELHAHNYLIGLAKEGKPQTAGPERVFSFLAGLSGEMQNLKLVINGRINRIEQKVLKGRLRECYV